jgi:hypothetical protein
MHIIFGKDEALQLKNKYTVLELDLIQFGQDGPVAPAYCVIENIAIPDLPKVQSMQTLHENLISNYRDRDWKYCLDATEHLQGFWGGELDSFYQTLRDRIQPFLDNPPPDNWTPVIQK